MTREELRTAAASDVHGQTVADHQRTAHLDLRPVTCDEARREPAREQGRQDVCFEHGKTVADADPLSATEREVGERVARLLALWQKAIRIEAFRFVPELGMPVCSVRKQHEVGAG